MLTLFNNNFYNLIEQALDTVVTVALYHDEAM